MAYQRLNAPTPLVEHDKSNATLPRGLRGYRKYKNGLLNVTPIKGEIELVKRNARDSPLLRLPPEIRAMIWEFTIGGNMIRPSLKNAHFRKTNGYAYHFAPQHRFSLLEVSRQIYFEAAILVWKLSTFRFRDAADLRSWLNSATVTHKLIHNVEVGAHRPGRNGECAWFNTDIPDLKKTEENLAKLPSVELYEIQICKTENQMGNTRRSREVVSNITKEGEGKKSISPSVRVLPIYCWSFYYNGGVNKVV